MVLSFWSKLFLLIDLATGMFASFTGSYVITLISIANLYIIITLSAPIRYHENKLLFSLSTLICVPCNIRICSNFLLALNESNVLFLQQVAIGTLIAIGLTSIEEIILLLVGYLIWGEQDNILK